MQDQSSPSTPLQTGAGQMKPEASGVRRAYASGRAARRSSNDDATSKSCEGWVSCGRCSRTTVVACEACAEVVSAFTLIAFVQGTSNGSRILIGGSWTPGSGRRSAAPAPPGRIVLGPEEPRQRLAARRTGAGARSRPRSPSRRPRQVRLPTNPGPQVTTIRAVQSTDHKNTGRRMTNEI